MKKRLNSIFLLSLFFLFLSVGFVYSATYKGNFEVGEEGGNVVIGNPDCSPDWECVLTECIDGSQTWICNDNNQCPDTTYPSNHGETQSCSTGDDDTTSDTTTSSGGGSSGGGSSGGGGGGGSATTTTSSSNYGSNGIISKDTCTENWVCGEWSKTRKECGVRTCVDTNKCETEESKPLESVECSGLFRTTGNAVSDFSKTGAGKGIFAVLIAFLIIGVFMFISSKRKQK